MDGTIFKILIRNVDFVIKTLTIGGTILAMVSVVLYLKADIKKEISEKLQDKNMIESMVREIRPLFLIFNDKGNVIFDNGCEDYIDLNSIGVKIENGQKKIVLKSKKYLKSAPIITSLDADMYFYTANHISTYQWEFPTLESSWVMFDSKIEPPPLRFKLEIFR